MKTRAFIVLSILALAACKTDLQKENGVLQKSVSELTLKVSALEADNERLKKQIQLLTETTDNLTEVLKAQQALGTQPDAKRTPRPTASPAR